MKVISKISDPFSLGQVMQQGRLEQGLSQRELAGRLGISQRWIWEMEQGKPGILMDRLFGILDHLGVTMLVELDMEDSAET